MIRRAARLPPGTVSRRDKIGILTDKLANERVETRVGTGAGDLRT